MFLLKDLQNILSEGLQAYMAYREQLHQCEKRLAEATLQLLKFYRPTSRRALGASETDLTREVCIPSRGPGATGGTGSEAESADSEPVLLAYERTLTKLEQMQVLLVASSHYYTFI